MNTAKFYELNLDCLFDILETGTGSEHHHKFKLRCKSCQHEWWNWDDVLRNKAKYIYCPACGSTNREYSERKYYEKTGYPANRLDWNERINDSALASQFILVETNCKDLKLKCKTCGESFWKNKSAYYHVEENACICPNCKMNQFGFKGSLTVVPEFVSDVVRMYQSGINQKEIVETLGISYAQCVYWLKKKGLYDPKRRQHSFSVGAAQKRNEQKKAEAESRMALELLAQGFIYVSGYKNKASECVIHHTTCGRSFERVPLYFKGECPLCKQDEIDAKRYLKRMKSVEWKRKTEEQREAKQKRVELKEYHRLYDAHICVWCNKIFTIKEYEEREGKRNVNTLSHCSLECKEQHKRFLLKRSNRVHGHHRERARKHGVEYIPGITLEKLVNRDGLTCALCGGICDWNDKRYGDCGPLYPSIDHITPISKGGAHTWDNVQVAHFDCNSAKRDRLDYICGA